MVVHKNGYVVITAVHKGGYVVLRVHDSITWMVMVDFIERFIFWRCMWPREMNRRARRTVGIVRGNDDLYHVAARIELHHSHKPNITSTINPSWQIMTIILYKLVAIPNV